MPAWAISLSFQPSSQTVGVGAAFDVNLVVTGLEDGINEIVGAFALDVTYNATVLQATGATYSTLLGALGTDAFPDAPVLAPGLVSLLNGSLLSDLDLASLQPDSFTLATIHFSALSPGTSLLTFAGTTELVGRNAATLQFNRLQGAVQVNAAAVPEPGTILLLGAGLGLLFSLRRRLGR